jgi:hypothetical protein
MSRRQRDDEEKQSFLIATQTYYESYHGKVEHLGYPRLVAGCADCHGFHSILPQNNPKSLISDARLAETCGKCHPHANKNFVLWLPHATHNDPEQEPVLYGVFIIMTTYLFQFWDFLASLHPLVEKGLLGKRELRAKGIFFPLANRTTFLNSSTSFGKKRQSAGPPTFIEVNRLIGTSKRTFPSINPDAHLL